MRKLPGRQRGITLFVTMILLILITLVAVTTFNAGRSSMQIVGNLQQRNDSVAAAQEAIETAISTTKLLDTPAAIISPGCGGTANTVCVDVNGDGTNDVTVAIKGHGATGNPGCVKAQVVKNAALDLSRTDDLACTVARQNFGVLGAPVGDSLCTDAMYEVVAVATDTVTQSNVTITEGVTVRLPSETVINNCP